MAYYDPHFSIMRINVPAIPSLPTARCMTNALYIAQTQHVYTPHQAITAPAGFLELRMIHCKIAA